MTRPEILLRWKSLLRRSRRLAVPIALDDAMARVDDVFVGSPIHGDDLKCRLSRKLREFTHTRRPTARGVSLGHR